MKVIINADGRTCTTVNPLGDKPYKGDYDHFDMIEGGNVQTYEDLAEYYSDLESWNQAESERQTFEIDGAIVDGEFIKYDEGDPRDTDVFLEAYPVGTTHDCEIVNGKAVIK